jgi:hypothetical protein
LRSLNLENRTARFELVATELIPRETAGTSVSICVMPAADPFLSVSNEEAIKKLKVRFPKAVTQGDPSNRSFFIELPLKTGGTFKAMLSWQQVKYLACTELTGDDLKDRKLPDDWPVT